MSEIKPGKLFMTYQTNSLSIQHYATTYTGRFSDRRTIIIPGHAVLLHVKSHWEVDWISEWEPNGECWNNLEQDNLYDVFLYEEQLIQFNSDDIENVMFEIEES